MKARKADSVLNRPKWEVAGAFGSVWTQLGGAADQGLRRRGSILDPLASFSILWAFDWETKKDQINQVKTLISRYLGETDILCIQDLCP